MRVLVVDDEEMLRLTTQRILEARGNKCDVAASAAEASQMLRERAYDLVLLDMSMPERSGLDFLPEIRQQHPNVAVVIMTAVQDRARATAAMELGADGFLTKPVPANELLTAAQAAVDGAIRRGERRQRPHS